MSILNQMITLLCETFSRQGWHSLQNIIQLLQRISRQKRDEARLPERERRIARSVCVPIDRVEFIQPDPMIYAQYYLMSLGLSVTWDNPDIRIFKDGAELKDSLLSPNTEYVIQARIWNNSTTCPILAMPVHFSYLDFGIGGVSVAIGTTKTDVGVKGGPNHPAYASFSWVTPSTSGHYCLQVQLAPPDDTNWNNNLGQRNINVGYSHSPAEFTFTVRNDTERRHIYRFEVDAYEITTPPCEEDGLLQMDERRRIAILARHRQSQHPLPVYWSVQFSPPSVVLAPNESRIVTVLISPPESFKGSQAINVHGYYDNHLAGGVTLMVISE